MRIRQHSLSSDSNNNVSQSKYMNQDDNQDLEETDHGMSIGKRNRRGSTNNSRMYPEIMNELPGQVALTFGRKQSVD